MQLENGEWFTFQNVACNIHKDIISSVELEVVIFNTICRRLWYGVIKRCVAKKSEQTVYAL